MSKEYESAGVSLEAGYESVRRIKKHIASTSRPGVMGNIGSFGGMFLCCLLYTSPSPRDFVLSRMPSSA